MQMTCDIATQTPELCTCAIGSDARAEVPATAVPLFSLFRPKAQRKVRRPATPTVDLPGVHVLRLQRDPVACRGMQVLVVIRHGESEFNAALQTGNGWVDPKLYDPSLTAKGCNQARHLRQRLLQEMQQNASIIGHNANALWVTSPLRRCIQTFLLSCPLLPNTASDLDSTSCGQKAVCQQVQDKLAVLQGDSLPPVRIVRYFANLISALCLDKLEEISTLMHVHTNCQTCAATLRSVCLLVGMSALHLAS